MDSSLLEMPNKGWEAICQRCPSCGFSELAGNWIRGLLEPLQALQFSDSRIIPL